MALFGRKKTTVGLDIGSGLIKVAVIDHSKREPELVRVTITPLLADAIVEGEVMDPGIVADAIKAAISAAGFDVLPGPPGPTTPRLLREVGVVLRRARREG